ncbi:MAG: nuclear transport factor 2 family protein [Anaerolineales bacterium]|nr:nuclear transport factor 2 family protein [Anaerolineales bacterium]
MDTSKITNPSIRAAFAALQAGDKAAWFAQFTADAELIDDGQPLDFKAFFEKAIGSEKFVSIDEVAQDGTEVIGTIETEQWGSFKAYFRFHPNTEGKLSKLEIGNAANRS